MNDQEITVLFGTAALFAEKTYKELFNKNPDTNNRATQDLLDTLMQAWLSGYNFLRKSPELSYSIEEIFCFYVE